MKLKSSEVKTTWSLANVLEQGKVYAEQILQCNRNRWENHGSFLNLKCIFVNFLLVFLYTDVLIHL
jgi:hypothetical protein